MAAALKAAEAMAPNHPHPGTETAAKNVALGPLTATRLPGHETGGRTGRRPA
ncbi:hypothetical protein [Streptomyces lincolnensis]|uniref:hypothetical protein n=1 Tax=Streptomyces lincolnensis TaxID=1915 RepID=UPI0037D25FB8